MRRGVVRAAVFALLASLTFTPLAVLPDLAPVASAHGGGDNGGSAYYGPSTYPVGIFNSAFEPNQANSVLLKDYVRWQNDDPNVHHVKSLDGKYNSGPIPAYGSATWIPNATGNVTFYLVENPGSKLAIHVDPIPGINHPPRVTFSNVVPGQTVKGTFVVKGTATDPDGDQMQLQIRVDSGAWHLIDYMHNGTWNKTWETRFVTNGVHNLSVAAQDFAGAYSLQLRVPVIVANKNGTDPGTAIPPTVEITSPQDGDHVGGYVVIEGTANSADNASKLTVQINLDHTYWAPAYGGGRWTYSWDTRGAADGEHTVDVRASEGTLVGEVVTFHYFIGNYRNDGPVVNILKPNDHERVDGLVTISGTALDPTNAPFTVFVRVDGAQGRAATGTSRWSYAWKSDDVTNGIHAIEVYAKSKNGTGEAARVSVDVDNANSRARPNVAILYPGAADELIGPVLIRGTSNSSLNDAVKVQLKIDDGPWRLADGGNVWSYTWNSTDVGNGVHHLTVRAYDGYATSQELTALLLVRNPVLGPATHTTLLSTGTSNNEDPVNAGGGSHFLPAPSAMLAVTAIAALAVALRSRRTR
ncbi:MAG: Ig-like domain-containing protein [Thermoplasmatota archaeon]